MSDDLAGGGFASLLRKIRDRTPARLLVGRAGLAYTTATQLELRQAHAAATDAVRGELEFGITFARDFIGAQGLFEVCTEASSKDEFLLRPDRGRRLSAAAREEIARRCSARADLQIAIGDGLSVTAIAAQVPGLLPLIRDGALKRGWSVGQPFVIRHCRVGAINDIGDLLSPAVVVLLIGERPGLATSESLSAYMAYRPSAGHTDANRNLISNIHSRGVSLSDAAARILNLAAQMMSARSSGVQLKEDFSASGLPGQS